MTTECRTFFEHLDICEPDINLEVESGKHGAQTDKMLEGIEKEIDKYITILTSHFY